MFGSSKAGGQPPERTKAAEPLTDQFDDMPPMPEGPWPSPAASPAAPVRKAFNYSEKPKPAPADEASHLYIGSSIRLKGEIAACELMRVDGVYEGIARARQLVVCPGGSFVGTADIDEVEIHGSFEGTLHVRGRLFLRKNGKIRGTFSYGELEIERGGEIDGRILPHDRKAAPIKTAEPVAVAAPRPVPVPAPKPAGAVNGAGPSPVR
jgi:cytoskeletal protein CcmA (bactofilin family)